MPISALDDMSLILTKAYKSGFFENIKPQEVNFLKQEAASLFSDDSIFVSRVDWFKDVRSYTNEGDPDDTGAISRAHAGNKVVFYPDGDYNPGAIRNIYGPSTYKNALGPRWQAGALGSPISDPEPVMWVDKYSSASRAVNAAEWDNGAIYAALYKESGDAYGAAMTAFARHDSIDSGQLVAMHARAESRKNESQTWAAWIYAHASNPAMIPISTFGIELDMNIKTVDPGWMLTGGVGASVGHLIVTADNSGPVTTAMMIGKGLSAAADGKFWTGINIRPDSIMPAGTNTGVGINNGEAFRIHGGSISANQYGGIRFGSGFYNYGISFVEVGTISSNAALVFKDGHRIVVGTSPSSSKYVAFDATLSQLNMSNLTLAFGGTQVVSSRKTGWNATTGTPLRGTFAGDTATLVQTSQTLAALITDLRSHGLIGT